jgi:hypothetical protein
MFKNQLKHFYEGKYSKLSNTIKLQIMNFFGKKGTISEYVESYLYPEKYYNTYAKILNINEEELESVGELCDKPNLKKENLEKELVSIKLFK